MSTRATYQINKTVFYCHMDGYPTGAAVRFAQMIAAHTVPDYERGYDPIESRRGGWEFAFIRGVMDAEPTEGHDAHGDTEYRYTLTAGERGAFTTIRCDARNRDDVWIKGAVYDLADWVNDQRAVSARQLRTFYAKYPERFAGHDPAADALAEIPVIVRVKEPSEYGAGLIRYATLDNATKIAVLLLKQGSGFQEGNPNKVSFLNRWQAWRDVVEPVSTVA